LWLGRPLTGLLELGTVAARGLLRAFTNICEAADI